MSVLVHINTNTFRRRVFEVKKNQHLLDYVADSGNTSEDEYAQFMARLQRIDNAILQLDQSVMLLELF